MEKLHSIILYKLSITEHQAFMQSVKETAAKFPPVQLNIEKEFPRFLLALDALSLAITGQRGSAITTELLTLDRHRLKTYSAIRGRLKNTLASPFEAEREAAKTLHFRLMQRGQIRRKNYAGKTVSIKFLCNNLLDEKHFPLCEQLQITTWIEALREQNKLFHEKENQRSTDYATGRAGKVADARQAIDAVYNEMVARINATVTIGSATPEAEQFIRSVNKKIKQVKALKAWRRSMRAGKKRREAEKSLENERLVTGH